MRRSLLKSKDTLPIVPHGDNGPAFGLRFRRDRCRCIPAASGASLASFFAGRSIFDKAEEIKWSLVDPRDLGALEAKAGHQTLLIEGEGVDAAVQRVGGEAAGHSFVHDDDARAGADLPAARVIYPIHRLLIHEKERVTEFLSTGLQAIGGC